MAAPADRDRVRERLAEATVACHRARNAGSLAQARRIAHDLAFELAPVLGPVPRAADSVAGPAGAGFPGFPRSRPGTAMTRRPRHRRYIGGAPVYESWESSAGPRPELVRGPVKPPPAPQTRETSLGRSGAAGVLRSPSASAARGAVPGAEDHPAEGIRHGRALSFPARARANFQAPCDGLAYARALLVARGFSAGFS